MLWLAHHLQEVILPANVQQGEKCNKLALQDAPLQVWGWKALRAQGALHLTHVTYHMIRNIKHFGMHECCKSPLDDSACYVIACACHRLRRINIVRERRINVMTL
jgi:hypothetical protein